MQPTNQEEPDKNQRSQRTKNNPTKINATGKPTLARDANAKRAPNSRQAQRKPTQPTNQEQPRENQRNRQNNSRNGRQRKAKVPNSRQQYPNRKSTQATKQEEPNENQRSQRTKKNLTKINAICTPTLATDANAKQTCQTAAKNTPTDINAANEPRKPNENQRDRQANFRNGRAKVPKQPPRTTQQKSKQPTKQEEPNENQRSQSTPPAQTETTYNTPARPHDQRQTQRKPTQSAHQLYRKPCVHHRVIRCTFRVQA